MQRRRLLSAVSSRERGGGRRPRGSAERPEIKVTLGLTPVRAASGVCGGNCVQTCEKHMTDRKLKNFFLKNRTIKSYGWCRNMERTAFHSFV